MDDLAAFITARLDEDEAAAMAAVHRAFRSWHIEPWFNGETLNDGRTEKSDVWGTTGYQATLNGALDTPTADHIARHDPARVLREVAAERAILAEHAITDWTAYGDHMCARCHRERTDEDQLTWLTWPCPTIRHLAAIWSDHPDYRAEWAASPSAT